MENEFRTSHYWKLKGIQNLNSTGSKITDVGSDAFLSTKG